MTEDLGLFGENKFLVRLKAKKCLFFFLSGGKEYPFLDLHREDLGGRKGRTPGKESMSEWAEPEGEAMSELGNSMMCQGHDLHL